MLVLSASCFLAATSTAARSKPNFTERVDELFVAENSGDRFDRGEEIAGERLVVVDHLVNVYLGLDHLGNSLVLSDFLFQL